MSDRYQQPAPGTLLDSWGEVLNQNFFDIGQDVDALEADVQSTVWHLAVGEALPAEVEPGDTIIRYEP